ncbi:MAG: Z1 domain-containing protein [Bacteroidota bacterium]|nr:Z1 domain-containing protein [Bacteroidota bacterium]
MKKTGKFYLYKKQKENYTTALTKCIEGTVEDLLSNQTSPRKPGMLLGRVQAGKTFAYCGIIALALDNGFESIVVLTKGTKFLLSQTYKRLRSEFKEFVEDDLVEVLDIMKVNVLSGYQQNKKLIFCVKKEDDNLNRLIRTYRNHDRLKKSKTLIIDDEADFCGLSFRRNSGEIQVGTIMGQISSFRKLLTDSDFLLVTATPYSLYLQPDGYQEINGQLLAPTRPVFTHLVPKHDKYIGGDEFFNLPSNESESIFHDIFEEITNDELRVLRTPRSIRLNPNIRIHGVDGLWDALLNFIVGGSIRRIQDKEQKVTPKKYSFVVHTETQKVRHDWQADIVACCLRNYSSLLQLDSKSFAELIKVYYDYFKYSINKLSDTKMPSFKKVLESVKSALVDGYICVQTVNSDTDTEALMDEATGQLELSSPFMIFVGGTILDRGISVENLIAFWYGRSPRRFQMDTVLQHLRCFGPRPINDMAITRMYTSLGIYRVLESMHRIENALWESIEKNGPNCPINFIQRELEGVIPCSPNKLLLSDVHTITAGRRILPIGFNTQTQSIQKKITMRVDHILHLLYNPYQQDLSTIIKISYTEFCSIMDNIWEGLLFEDHYQLPLSEMKSLAKHLIKQDKDTNYINLIVRTNRNISRKRFDGRFEDVPDTAAGSKSELQLARKHGMKTPTLILLRQNGKSDLGWQGEAFWWPILVAQQELTTTLFSRT